MKKTSFLFFFVLALSACAGLRTSSEYLLRGDGYFKDGNPARALESYNRAIALNPDNLEAYASRGAVHFFQGNYDLAEADFKLVIDKNPYQADAYTAYSSVLAAKGNFNEALQVLELALALKPSKPEIFFTRAGIYFMLGRYAEAVTDYTSVINLRPAADVYNARGAAYLRMGKQTLAQQDFDTAQNAKIPASLNVYSMID